MAVSTLCVYISAEQENATSEWKARSDVSEVASGYSDRLTLLARSYNYVMPRLRHHRRSTAPFVSSIQKIAPLTVKGCHQRGTQPHSKDVAPKTFEPQNQNICDNRNALSICSRHSQAGGYASWCTSSVAVQPQRHRLINSMLTWDQPQAAFLLITRVPGHVALFGEAHEGLQCIFPINILDCAQCAQ